MSAVLWAERSFRPAWPENFVNKVMRGSHVRNSDTKTDKLRSSAPISIETVSVTHMTLYSAFLSDQSILKRPEVTSEEQMSLSKREPRGDQGQHECSLRSPSPLRIRTCCIDVDDFGVRFTVADLKRLNKKYALFSRSTLTSLRAGRVPTPSLCVCSFNADERRNPPAFTSHCCHCGEGLCGAECRMLSYV